MLVQKSLLEAMSHTAGQPVITYDDRLALLVTEHGTAAADVDRNSSVKHSSVPSC